MAWRTSWPQKPGAIFWKRYGNSHLKRKKAFPIRSSLPFDKIIGILGYYNIEIFQDIFIPRTKNSCYFASELDESTDTAVLSGLFINKNQKLNKGCWNLFSFATPHQLECTQRRHSDTDCFLRGKWHSHRLKAYKCMFKDMSVLVAVHVAAAAVVKGTSPPSQMPPPSWGC